MDLRVGDIVSASGGALRQGDPATVVKGVSTDSRKVAPGEVFFALKGPNFDGHAFVKDVALKGALGAVVEGGRTPAGLPKGFAVIEAWDTLRALGDTARSKRMRFPGPLVAVSGTAGKTTTKEMIASILQVRRKVLKTEGNLNNLIGLPITLLGLVSDHEAAVVELGISLPHEMERLVKISEPDVAVITNIGRAHLENLGSPEGVAAAKGALFMDLKHGARRIVNLDDPMVVALASKEGALDGGSITYSLRRDADVRVLERKVREDLTGLDTVYDVRGELIEVSFRAPGLPNAVNGAAAIGAAIAIGASIEEAKEGLEALSPVHGRMEVLRLGWITVVDDTYNANPESVSYALRTVSAAPGRKVAVLGEMRELGAWSRESHREIGKVAAEAGFCLVVAIGGFSGEVADGAVEGGLKEGVFTFPSKAEAVRALGELLREGDTVIVKASRSSGLEEVVEGIKALEGPKGLIRAAR